MGICVEPGETKHDIGFELRRESVIFTLTDGDEEGEDVEIGKKDLVKIKSLLCDEEWSERLLPSREV